MSARSTLVIGATGILAPLAAALGRRGATVTAVGRRAASPQPGVHPLALDATSATGIRAIAAAGPYEAAVLYGPAVGVECGACFDARAAADRLRELLAAVDGCALMILTSAAFDPAHGAGSGTFPACARLRPQDRVLVLGWSGAPGAARWHTPEEASAAALDALTRGEDAMLGRVRPWNERPGGS